jgi:multisubunit Na+/H+ antiporter MnhG subunit
VLSGTAAARSYPYSQSMQTDYVKTALMGVWILAVGVLGYVLGATSFVGWTVLVAMALTPPVLMTRLWRAPSQSMSESIREALR